MIPEESRTTKPKDGDLEGQHEKQPDKLPEYLPTNGGIEPPPPYDAIPPPDYSSDIGDDRTGSFASKKVQMEFTRKVYAVQSVQLLVTTALVGAFTYYDDPEDWDRFSLVGGIVLLACLI